MEGVDEKEAGVVLIISTNESHRRTLWMRDNPVVSNIGYCSSRGYMAPEYATKGHLTDKADVYSFGIVMLEIIGGKSNTSYGPGESVYLLDWAYVLKEQGNLLELVDLQLGLDYPKEEALLLLNLTLQCTNISPTLRPTMSTVVSILEGRMPDEIISLNLLNSGALQMPCLETPSVDSPQSVSNNEEALGALYSYEV